jgi:hypothetical protein
LWEFSEIAENPLITGFYARGIADVPSAFMPPFYPLLLTGIYKVFAGAQSSPNRAITGSIVKHPVLTVIICGISSVRSSLAGKTGV